MRFTVGDLAEIDAGRVGVRNILAVGRDNGTDNRRLLGIRGDALFGDEMGSRRSTMPKKTNADEKKCQESDRNCEYVLLLLREDREISIGFAVTVGSITAEGCAEVSLDGRMGRNSWTGAMKR